ncbi:hypothetical protein [Spirosoma rhododendri]|uniref:Uncharacterized protein n=1 Tax=Spirosoma rhododendri TaxID=2728024 RepID=A0A7L5DYS9_9BACT|nr:hypothetical protein [Spirosoma rhododendri]QJD81137.1 hypothetical protein HH216_23960 [Spirosoma rhododendri]
MNIEKLASWIAPLVFGVVLGLYWTFHGLYFTLYGTPDQQRDYPLEIILGLPLAAFCVAIHLLVRRLTNDNPLYIWIVEGVLIAPVFYFFLRSS